jgi:hypothetical protein
MAGTEACISEQFDQAAGSAGSVQGRCSGDWRHSVRGRKPSGRAAVLAALLYVGLRCPNVHCSATGSASS